MKITNFVYKGYSYSDEKLSSWSTYFEYLLWLRNNEILFESNTYFTQNGGFYINNGNSANNYFPEYRYMFGLVLLKLQSHK